MKLSLAPAILLAVCSFAITACSVTTSADDDDTSKGANGDDDAKGDDDQTGDDDDETTPPEPPHSLGTIVLGEAHSSSSRSQTTPIVTASFWPDASKAAACGTQKLEGCEIVTVPKCENSKGESTCEAGEYCTWSDDCSATCKMQPLCEDACDEDEICELDPSGQEDNEGRCVKRDTFDAGPLAFDGTTTAITLFPPYAYESDGRGAPFLAGAKLHAQAQGASAAGFEAFDEEFTATTFIQTTGKISRTDAFGTSDLPLAWVAGGDDVVIALSGPGGSATCKAKDADGKFDVPRKVVDAVLDNELGAGSTPMLNVTISRERTELKKDKKAVGDSVNGVSVIPEGWLQLKTVSSESTSLTGCSTGYLACSETGSECTDVKNDADNCGSCGNECGSGKICAGGTCTTTANACKACVADAQEGACESETSACQASSACVALNNCVAACTTQECYDTCSTSNANGVDALNKLNQCLMSVCSSYCPN